MVVQWEDNFYDGNRGHTYLGDPEHRRQIYPDYVAMAQGFDVPCERVMFKKDLRAAMQRMLDSDQPYVLDVIVPLHRARDAVHSRRQDGGGHDLEAVIRPRQTLVSRAIFATLARHAQTSPLAGCRDVCRPIARRRA